MSGTVYALVFRATGAVLYVGQTRQKPEARWLQHVSRKTAITNLYRSFGGERCFAFVVIEQVPIDQLNTREEFWIGHYGTMHPNGFNHRPGGRAKGTSERVKAKLAARSKHMWAQDGFRENETRRRKRVWADPAHRERMAACRRATWADLEFKAKMGAKQRATWTAERKLKHAAAISAKWADPEYKAEVAKRISDAHKVLAENDDYRRAQSERINQRWRKFRASSL